MRGGFLAFLGLKSPIPLFCLFKYELSPSIKWFLPHDLSFHLLFFCFLMFLPPTCCDMWLLISFCVGDSIGSVASIRQRSHIKSMFVNMLHQTWNLRYSRHLRIISFIDLEPFLLAINLDVVSSNVFSSLISMFKYKGITVLNQ